MSSGAKAFSSFLLYFGLNSERVRREAFLNLFSSEPRGVRVVFGFRFFPVSPEASRFRLMFLTVSSRGFRWDLLDGGSFEPVSAFASRKTRRKGLISEFFGKFIIDLLYHE